MYQNNAKELQISEERNQRTKKQTNKKIKTTGLGTLEKEALLPVRDCSSILALTY